MRSSAEKSSVAAAMGAMALGGGAAAQSAESDEAAKLCNVCKEPSTQKCSHCKKVYYCSADHQREDWKKHKALCKPS